jgi:flagellum-specific ATP synthase
VASTEHVQAARRFRQLHSRHSKARDLIQIGAYSPGHDHDLDQAVQLHAPMTEFLQQGMHERALLDASIEQLSAVLN